MKLKNQTQDSFLRSLGVDVSKKSSDALAFPVALLMTMLIANLKRRISNVITKRQTQIVGEAEYIFAASLNAIAKSVSEIADPSSISISNTFASLANMAQIAKMGAATSGTKSTNDSLGELRDSLAVKSWLKKNPNLSKDSKNPVAMLFKGILINSGTPQVEGTINLPPLDMDVSLAVDTKQPNQSSFVVELLSHAGRGAEYTVAHNQILSISGVTMNLWIFIHSPKFALLSYWDQMSFLIAVYEYLKMTETKEDYEINFPSMMARSVPSSLGSILSAACENYIVLYTELSLIQHYAQLSISATMIADTLPFLETMTSGINHEQALGRLKKWTTDLKIDSQFFNAVQSGINKAVDKLKLLYDVTHLLTPSTYAKIIESAPPEALTDLEEKKKTIVYAPGSSALSLTASIPFYLSYGAQGSLLTGLETILNSVYLLQQLTESTRNGAHSIMLDPSRASWGGTYMDNLLEISTRGSLTELISPDMSQIYDLDLSTTVYNTEAMAVGSGAKTPKRVLALEKYQWSVINLTAFILSQRDKQISSYAFTPACVGRENDDSHMPSTSLLPLQYVSIESSVIPFDFYAIEKLGAFIDHASKDYMPYLQYMFYKLASKSAMTLECVDVMSAFCAIYKKDSTWKVLVPSYAAIYGVPWKAIIEKNDFDPEAAFNFSSKNVPRPGSVIFLDEHGCVLKHGANPVLRLENSTSSKPSYCIHLWEHVPVNINTEQFPIYSINGSMIAIPLDKRILSVVLEKMSGSANATPREIAEAVRSVSLSTVESLGIQWSVWEYCSNIVAHRPHITMQSKFNNDQKTLLEQLDTQFKVCAGIGSPDWINTDMLQAKLSLLLTTTPELIDPSTLCVIREEGLSAINTHDTFRTTNVIASAPPVLAARTNGEPPKAVNNQEEVPGDIKVKIATDADTQNKRPEEIEKQISDAVII